MIQLIQDQDQESMYFQSSLDSSDHHPGEITIGLHEI